MSKEEQKKVKGKFYTLFIDNAEHHVDKSELTGKEIMDLGGYTLRSRLVTNP